MSSEGMHEKSPSKKTEEQQISGSKDGNPLEFEWAETITDGFPFQSGYEEAAFSENIQGEDRQNQQIHSNQEIGTISQAGLILDHLELGYDDYDEYEDDQCDYCDNKDRQFYENACIIKRLYSKYASSQNYYYTRDINEILSNGRTHAVIEFKDVQTADYEAEYLASFYPIQEEKQISSQLTEYYKFHRDNPRLFMLPETIILDEFHTKKRRYDYYRIAQLIEQENANNPQRPPKGIIGEKPPLRTNESSRPHSEDDPDDNDQIRNNEAGQIDGNLLEDISSFNFKSVQSQHEEGKNNEEKILGVVDTKTAELKSELGEFKVSQQVYQKLKHTVEKDKEKEKLSAQTKPRTGLKRDDDQQSQQQSVTLQELNLKLGEIVTNQSRISTQNFSLSKMNEDDNKYFDGKELDNFLAFLNNTKQLKQIQVQNVPQSNAMYAQNIGNSKLIASNGQKNKQTIQGISDQLSNNNKNNDNQLRKNEGNLGQDSKKQNTASRGATGKRGISEDHQSNSAKISNLLETARGQVEKQKMFESTQKNNKMSKETADQQEQNVGKLGKETPSSQIPLQQQKQPKKRANLQLKLDDIDFYSADHKDLQYDGGGGGTFGGTVPQGMIPSSLSVRSARETATQQEIPQTNFTGPLSCSAALTKNSFKSSQKPNISPFFKGEKSSSQSQKKGIKDKFSSPNNDAIPNKSQKQAEFNINITKPQQQQQQQQLQQFLQPSSPSQNPAITKPLQNQLQASKQQQLQQSLQLQQQLHYSSNLARNTQLHSVSQNSFAQKLDTKESQLHTPRQPQPSIQMTAPVTGNSAKVPIIKCPTNNLTKPQISPRGIIQPPKSIESKDELSNKLSILNQQQQQLTSQQTNQVFQQHLQANAAAFLRKSSSTSNSNSKINVNALQKKQSQPLALQARQSSQMLNGSNPKNQKVFGNQKQLKFKLKLDLLDNSKEKSSQGLLNNSSSQNTFPANMHNSNNSNTPYLKDPLSQRSCSSKNMEQQTPKYNFYEMFRQQIASQAYSSAISNNANSNSASLKANHPMNQQATSAKGSALHMLNLINAQQTQSRALAQVQQSKQQSPSSSPSNRQTKAQPNNPQIISSQLQVAGNYQQKQLNQPCDAEGYQQNNPHLSVSRKISPKNANQRDQPNSQKYILPEEHNPSFKNIKAQSPSHSSSASPLQQVLSVKIIKQTKKKDDLTFNQTGDEKESISNKNSLDLTSQRKVINVVHSSTTRSENHTRKNSQTNQSNNFAYDKVQQQQQQQQQVSIAAALADLTKQVSRNSSLEMNNPNLNRKKSPQFLKFDSNEVSKNIQNLIQQSIEINQQIPHVPISMQSARNFKQEGVTHTIPLPKPGGGGGAAVGGGGTMYGKGQLSAYHQPRPLISQAQMQLPSEQFYDLSNYESGAIPNSTGLVSNNISKLQQSGITPNTAGGGKSGNQSNMIFNSSQMPSNSALASFAILNNASTVNHCLDHQGQSQQQQSISQRILQTATLRHQALKSQQQTKSQPYSHLWQSQAQDKSNQLTIQLQPQTPSAGNVPQSCSNIGILQPSMNSGSLSVRVNPNGSSALRGCTTKLSSPKAEKKVVCLHKHTKSENLVNLLSHSEVNLLQNQLSQQQTQGIQHAKKQIKNQAHFPSNEAIIKQQPQTLQQPSNSSSLAENSQVFQQQNFLNQLHFNNSNAFSNRSTNTCDIYNTNNNQEQSTNNAKNNEAFMLAIGSSHLITPRASCSPLGGVFSEKVNRGMKNKKQSVASPLSTRSGQINFQRDQFSSTNNSSNANTNSQNNNTNNQHNNTNSQNNNNMPNQNSSSNNNSTSHQANSSLNYLQPPTATTQPQSSTQLPPSNQQTTSTAKKHLMHGQISSLFTVSPSTLTGQIFGASQTPSLPVSFISSKKAKKKQIF